MLLNTLPSSGPALASACLASARACLASARACLASARACLAFGGGGGGRGRHSGVTDLLNSADPSEAGAAERKASRS